MTSAARYLRLLYSFGRFGLSREMAFRGNFLIKVTVEILWLGILLLFYATVFSQTSTIAGWSGPHYMVFLGCYFTLEGFMEASFLGNCSEFSELVRTGELDFFLLQPIDEQFLISCRNVEWSSVPSIFMGLGVMAIGLFQSGWEFDALRVFLFVLLCICGAGIAYSILIVLTSAAVWMTRNQSLYELWWLVMSLMRYPKDIFTGTWFAPLSWFFTFIIPVMLVVNVPARTMIQVFEPRMIVFTFVVTGISLYATRRFFRFSLQRYRSASS